MAGAATVGTHPDDEASRARAGSAAHGPSILARRRARAAARSASGLIRSKNVVDAETAAAMRALLHRQRVAALGTLHRDEPAVSMVPFALAADGLRLIIHISALATHTRDMQTHPRVSLMVMADPVPDVSAQATPRVTLQADATFVARDDEAFIPARARYLARFPDAATMFELADFSIVLLDPVSARLVAGFGRAHALVGDRLARWLRGA